MKLLAVEAAEIEIISAAVESMISSRGEMKYNRQSRSFEITGSRFMWEKSATHGYRTRSGLHFMDVQSVRAQSLNTDRPTDVQELLSIGIEEGEDGQAAITLKFAANRSIELAVECVNASLTDLGQHWHTDRIPKHDLDEMKTDQSQID